MMSTTPSNSDHLSRSSNHIFNDIPSFFSSQDGVFKTIEEAEYGLRGILRILTGASNKGALPSYLIQNFEVEFSTEYKREHLRHDHARAALVVCAPQTKGELSFNLQKRTQEILLRYMVGIEEMKTRGLTQAYRSLDGLARKKLIAREKIFQKKSLKKQSSKKRSKS
ncbi:MAG: hypothetical protein V4654_04515 [Bdellovibrionota bacterium]